MSVSAQTERFVRSRANDRCEYCLMHQSLQGATFHIEHIIPESRGGPTEDADNLALACPSCNLRKSNRELVPDPESPVEVRLFNPRVDSWVDHFRCQGLEVIGITAIGRATAAALDFNHSRRLQIRKAEERFSLFPPMG
jgi:hypothetical protein